MKTNRTYWGLLRRREVLMPTWRMAVVMLVVLALLVFAAIKGLYPFLAVTEPVSGGILVVEGWLPDFGMKMVKDEFATGRYERLCVTGGPLDTGSFLSEYANFADLGAARMIKIGMDKTNVFSVPAPAVKQDRTYTSAVALRKWLEARHMSPASVHVLTMGPHARRSRLMFEKAMGDKVKIGITALENPDYESSKWWTSSQGFRTVISEAIAYAYARVLFRPATATAPGN